jgi:hypothetical protein
LRQRRTPESVEPEPEATAATPRKGQGTQEQSARPQSEIENINPAPARDRHQFRLATAATDRGGPRARREPMTKPTNNIPPNATNIVPMLPLKRQARQAAAREAACEFAADNKQEAIWRFMDAEFAFADVFDRMIKLHDKIKRTEKPSAKLRALMAKAETAFRTAGDEQDDALDDLIAAEMAYRAADKAYSKGVRHG